MANKVAKFLEHEGYLNEALEISQDIDQRISLCVALSKLDVAMKLLSTEQDERQRSLKLKQIGDLALEKGEVDLALEAFTLANDTSGLFLLGSALGDESIIQNVATTAFKEESYNMSMLASILIGDADRVADSLMAPGRFAEAAIFSRVYCPDKIPECVSSWKQDVKMMNQEVAECIASPMDTPQLFPEYPAAIEAQKKAKAARAAIRAPPVVV
jgi:coatomer subunit beta'